MTSKSGPLTASYSYRNNRINGVSYSSSGNQLSYNGITALRCAITHFETAAILVRAGAEVNAKTDDADSILAYAARKGEDNVVQLLLANGADPIDLRK